MAASYETSTTKTPKKQKIRTVVRNEVEQKWLDSNAIPDKGELVYGSDVNTLKIGDGIHKYEDLPAISGGEQGTMDYNELENKPSINNVTLSGNKTAGDLGFATVATSGSYEDLSNKPTIGNATITFTQGGVQKGSLTTNQTDNSTISLDITTVVDNVTTQSSTSALSANMGKELQDEINNLKARGRYLSLWNCATGLPATNPTVSPYNYATGDYFIVGTVAVSGQTNYRPDGSSYTIGVASTTVETSAVSPDDTYIYDGTHWILQYNTQKTVSFANIAGQPTDNSNLAAALNAKANTADLATVATTGDYDDLLNKPAIPAAQVNSDWDAVSGVAQILNKPTLGTMAAESASDYTKTSDLAAVAISGDYDDLINKPITPTATDQVAGIAKLYTTTGQNTDGSMTQKSITDALALKANSANLATVATSGSYEDLSNKPTIPTVGNGTITITQGGTSKGTFTTNQSGNTTIALDAGGGTVDQVYDATSANAQSGTAVAGAIGNKVTRTTVSSGAIAYGENSSGETTFTVTQSATNYALVQRTSAGQITVKLTPTTNSDAASKKYVDDSVATKATITLRDWSVNS